MAGWQKVSSFVQTGKDAGPLVCAPAYKVLPDRIGMRVFRDLRFGARLPINVFPTNTNIPDSHKYPENVDL